MLSNSLGPHGLGPPGASVYGIFQARILEWVFPSPGDLPHLKAALVTQAVKNLPSMPETQDQSLGRESSLEKGMAAHSNILAWRIPRTEEPGGLQFLGSQTAEHNWARTHTCWKISPISEILALLPWLSKLWSFCILCGTEMFWEVAAKMKSNFRENEYSWIYPKRQESLYSRANFVIITCLLKGNETRKNTER